MKRLASVDVVRTFAILGVIVLHTWPQANASANRAHVNQVDVFLDQIFRFAVPFFS